MVGGDANELGDVGGSPGKSSLFFLTASCPENGSAGARALWQAKHLKSWGVRRAPDGPWKSGGAVRSHAWSYS